MYIRFTNDQMYIRLDVNIYSVHICTYKHRKSTRCAMFTFELVRYVTSIYTVHVFKRNNNFTRFLHLRFVDDSLNPAELVRKVISSKVKTAKVVHVLWCEEIIFYRQIHRITKKKTFILNYKILCVKVKCTIHICLFVIPDYTKLSLSLSKRKIWKVKCCIWGITGLSLISTFHRLKMHHILI